MASSSAAAVRKSPWPMVPMDDALCLVLEHAQSLPTVRVPLDRAAGCVLAEDVVATEPQPAFSASIMDGYAVVASDGPGTYPVVGRITAGVDPDEKGIRVLPGTVAYITTGAKMPQGADAVAKVEDTESASEGSEETMVRILPTPAPTTAGQWVRPIGSDLPKGTKLLSAGMELGPAEVGLLASAVPLESAEAATVAVTGTPVVGVLSTGDELWDVLPQGGGGGGTGTTAASIRDSNRPTLLALYRQMLRGGNAQVVDLGIVRDVDGVEALAAAIKGALARCDVLVTSGGVSMGDADLLKPSLASLNATVHFGRLNMKPGKPTTFATINDPTTNTKKLVFGLPGNPVSCLVCSHLLVLPALRRLKGLAPAASMPPQVPVSLAAPTRLDPERPEFQRVVVMWDEGKKCFVGHSTGRQISSRLLSMRAANGLLCLPAGNETLPAGASIPCLLIGPLLPPHKTSGYAFPKAIALGGGNDEGPISVGLLTVSDRASDGTYEDKSGPAMATILTGEAFKAHGLQITVGQRAIVPDDPKQIAAKVQDWCDGCKLDAIFTSGGTGFAPRDLTPEAIKPLLEKEAPGVVYRIMELGTKHTPFAVLSRPVAGVRGQTFIVTLPGSPKAVKENLETVLPLLPKIFQLIRTATCDHKAPDAPAV